MNKWETFVMELDELPEDCDLELTIRTLNDGLDKYTYKRVKAEVSTDTGKFADSLQVRFGRGQLAKERFSIKVLNEVQRFPEKYL